MVDSVTTGFGRGFAFATGFPVTLCSTFSREMVSDDQDFTYRNVLDEDRPSHPRLGRFSCFRESTLSLETLLHFEAMYTLDIDSSFHLVLLHQV